MAHRHRSCGYGAETWQTPASGQSYRGRFQMRSHSSGKASQSWRSPCQKASMQAEQSAPPDRGHEAVRASGQRLVLAAAGDRQLVRHFGRHAHPSPSAGRAAQRDSYRPPPSSSVRGSAHRGGDPYPARRADGGAPWVHTRRAERTSPSMRAAVIGRFISRRIGVRSWKSAQGGVRHAGASDLGPWERSHHCGASDFRPWERPHHSEATDRGKHEDVCWATITSPHYPCPGAPETHRRQRSQCI